MKKEYFNPLRWKKSFLIAILVAFVSVWFLFLDTYSIFTKFKLGQEKEYLIERTELLKKQTSDLENKIEDLETNPDLLEKIAREEYGMRKPNETVYIIKSEE
ncbi:MAG: septum formation initiator family protein [Balneolaceae bacterium]